MHPTYASPVPQCALVTGVSGFTARHLVRELRRTGVRWIEGVGRVSQGICGCDHVTAVRLEEQDSLQELKAGLRANPPGWVFHLAGIWRGSVEELELINVDYTRRLLEVINDAAPEASVVIAGSAAEYGIPQNSGNAIEETLSGAPSTPYGLSKLRQTETARALSVRYGVRVGIARFFNLVGHGLSPSLLPGAIVHRARIALAEGADSIRVGNTDSLRDFVDVGDAVRALACIARAQTFGEVFNVCSGRPVSIHTLVEEILARFPRRLTARPDESLMRAGEATCIYGSYEKLSKRSGWTPTTPLSSSIAALCSDDLTP